MVAIIGKTCSDVPESEALKYVLGYAVGMIALFTVARYAMLARNLLAKKMELSREEEFGEKGVKLDDCSDTWSSEVDVMRPTRTRAPNGSFV